jgi:hypothetical protein
MADHHSPPHPPSLIAIWAVHLTTEKSQARKAHLPGQNLIPKRNANVKELMTYY